MIWGQEQNGDAGIAVESARSSTLQAGIVTKILSSTELNVLKSCNFIELDLGSIV